MASGCSLVVIDIENQVPHGLAQNRVEIKSNKNPKMFIEGRSITKSSPPV